MTQERKLQEAEARCWTLLSHSEKARVAGADEVRTVW